MTTTSPLVKEEHISCEICKKEVPLNEAVNPETADYIVHFCGLECYEEWKNRRASTIPGAASQVLKPRFSISPLLRPVKRPNLRDKNQKTFVAVE